MKLLKSIMPILAFVIAIGAALAFAPAKATNRPFSTQTVFYNTGSQTNCPNSKICSNISGALCVAGVSTYYDVQASLCTATSAFKWKP